MIDRNVIDEYLSKPYWIIDILPKQVPAKGGGQYFKIESYFLSGSRMDVICRQFTNVLLKLNCYDDITVCLMNTFESFDNPAPELLEQWITEKIPLCVIIQSAHVMIVVSGDDHYMPLYCEDEEMIGLVRDIACAEGLFMWNPRK